eukprot:726372-Pyramimonas_sp.AAC.1
MLACCAGGGWRSIGGSGVGRSGVGGWRSDCWNGGGWRSSGRASHHNSGVGRAMSCASSVSEACGDACVSARAEMRCALHRCCSMHAGTPPDVAL